MVIVMPTRRNRALAPTAIYFTDEQTVRLRRVARARRVSQSAIIRAGLDRALRELETTNDVPVDVLLHMRRPYADVPPDDGATLPQDARDEAKARRTTTK